MIKLNTIGKFLLNRIDKTPKNEAIGWIEKNQILSYDFNEYSKLIELLSFSLNHIGLKKKDKVSIMGSTNKEWHFFDLASLCTGGIVVPIYHTYLDHEAKYILDHAESKFLIIENDSYFEKINNAILSSKTLEVLISIKPLSQEQIEQLPKGVSYYTQEDLYTIAKKEIINEPDFFENIIQSIAPEDIATIIYTSGTTGVPKGAVITHEAFTQMLQNISKFVNNAINENDKALCFLPLSHVFGRCDSYLPLVFGFQTVYAESLEKIVDNISLVKPTIMLAVPRIFEKIYAKIMEQIQSGGIIKQEVFTWANNIANEYFETLDQDLTPSTALVLQFKLAQKIVFHKIYNRFGGRIRYFISGGAPLSPEIITFLRNANLTILEGYGLTETIAPCALNPFTKQIAGTIGKPMGDVEISFDVDGEILIKSKALFSEYYKSPEETEKAFVDGWFRSGDIGEFNKEGYLKITDRKKDIIITSGGKNVAPQKIENKLKLFPLIQEVLVVGDQKKYLTALVAIDKEAASKFLEDNGEAPEVNFDKLSENELIMLEIEKCFQKLNEELASFETIKTFKLLPLEVSIENYLTPSLKLKKKLLERDFKELIDSMYH